MPETGDRLGIDFQGQAGCAGHEFGSTPVLGS